MPCGGSGPIATVPADRVGLFIVFEGPEGSGKSTQLRLLYRRLRRAGLDVVCTREPGGTPLGERLRRLLKGMPGSESLVAEAELFLFLAARAQLVRAVIRPALAEGRVVLCDRYSPSTIAYQAYGRGLPLAQVTEADRLATGGLWPDLVVLLDLPVEVGLARRGRREADRFEAEELEFHRRVRAGYLESARAGETGFAGRWLVLDAQAPPRELARKVWACVRELLTQRGLSL
ncbi:MAG: dTMP kinase [Chloroflexota bacterium]